MTYMTADITRAWVHGAGGVKAEAKKTLSDSSTDAWLNLLTFVEGKLIVTIFMPYETALAYANAINTVNDRETAEAAVDPLGRGEESWGRPDLTKTIGEY